MKERNVKLRAGAGGRNGEEKKEKTHQGDTYPRFSFVF